MTSSSNPPESFSEVISLYLEDTWSKSQRQEIREEGLEYVADFIGPVVFSDNYDGGPVEDELIKEIYDGDYSQQARQLVSAFKDEKVDPWDKDIEPDRLQSSAEREYAQELVDQFLEENTWDVSANLRDDRTVNINIYDALNYDVLQQLQEEINQEFEVRVKVDSVEFSAQSLNKQELEELTLENVEEKLEEFTVDIKADLDGGTISPDYRTDEPSLLIQVEEYTDEVEDVLSVFNLS